MRSKNQPLIATNLKRWRKLKRGEYNEATVYVGGEPAVLQQYFRDENSAWHVVTPGKGEWLDITLEEGLLPPDRSKEPGA